LKIRPHDGFGKDSSRNIIQQERHRKYFLNGKGMGGKNINARR
jgi:hypothetical protein